MKVVKRTIQEEVDITEAKAWMLNKEAKSVAFTFGSDDTTLHMLPKLSDKEILELWKKQEKED